MKSFNKYQNSFEHLIQISEDYNLAEIASNLKAENYKLTNEYLYLVVIGQFKRGKSTLINALIGNDLLPTAVLPLTSIISMIKYGDEQTIKIIFKDEHVEYISQDELFDFITESGNPNNEKQVNLVELHFPSQFLKDGIVLIDTPGIGSLFLHNTKSTVSFIPKIDAAIFVLSIDPPITKTEYEFFKEVRNNVDKFYFVMNKIDTVDVNSCDKLIKYTKNILSSSDHGIVTPIFPVSAKLALEGKISKNKTILSVSGINDFENEIKNSINSEKFSILQTSIRRKYDKYITQITFSLELELYVLRTSVNTLQEKINNFNSELDKILVEKKLAIYIFNGEINELITNLWDDIREYSKSYAINLFSEISEYLKSISKTTTKSNLIPITRKYFSNKLSSDIENWRQKLEEDLVNKYSRLSEKAAGKINGIIKSISDITANLFDISSPLLFEIFTFKTIDKFSYKTNDYPLFLEIDIYKFLPYILPRNLMFKLVLKKIKVEIIDKSEINFGSVMAYYRNSIDESSLKFKFEMDEKVDQVIAYINSLVTSALKNKNLNEYLISSKQQKINNDLAMLKSLKID